jgi:hypothetical protein
MFKLRQRDMVLNEQEYTVHTLRGLPTSTGAPRLRLNIMVPNRPNKAYQNL